MLVLERICETASGAPRKLAMVYNGAPLSYGTFWRMIDGCRRSLAPHLPGKGLAVLWVDSLLESWILELALRPLGLDTAFIRSADQAALFESLDVAALITLASEPNKQVTALQQVKRLVLSDPSKQALNLTAPLPAYPEFAKAGGHVNLTSGTTGRYKLVLRDWGAGAGHMEARRRRYADVGEGFVPLGAETVLNVFNMGMWSGGGHGWPMFMWGIGGAVAIDQRAELARALDWTGLTHTLATPLYLAQLMALPAGAFAYRPEMQLIVNSGAVGPGLAREAMRRLTPRLLINMSSTEVGGWARSLIRSDDDLRWYKIDAGRVVEIVDEADQPLPAGRLGRVRVALRDDNATEYLADAETTAANFAGRWFYPGDLGELDGRGRIALFGRTSDVVSVGGVKLPVEPWERAIQERLGCDAVCIASGNWRTGAEEVYALVQSRRVIAAAEADAVVRQTLSEYPGEVHVRVVEDLPRTPTGKVRRIEIVQRLREGGFDPPAPGDLGALSAPALGR